MLCYMSTALFSFKDAAHDTDLHSGTFGFVHGCIACAQTEADLALSHMAAQRVTPAVPNPRQPAETVQTVETEQPVESDQTAESFSTESSIRYIRAA